MSRIARVLNDLGFQRLFGIVDGNQDVELEQLRARFPRYRFAAIPAPDVKTKRAVAAKEPIDGLTDEEGVVRPIYEEALRSLAAEVQLAMNSQSRRVTSDSGMHSQWGASP